MIGSVTIGAKLESRESQMVAKMWPAFAAATTLVPWVLLAYFFNHRVAPPPALNDNPAITFGLWMAVASPFMLALSVYMDRYLKIHALILAKWGPRGGTGGSGSAPPDPTDGGGDDDFGIEPPVVDPKIIEMIDRAVAPKAS